MFESPREVGEPLLQRVEGDEGIGGVGGRHLSRSQREGRRKVVQVLHHLLGELGEGGHVGGVGVGGRGLLRQLCEGFHRDADLRRVRAAKLPEGVGSVCWTWGKMAIILILINTKY